MTPPVVCAPNREGVAWHHACEPQRSVARLPHAHVRPNLSSRRVARLRAAFWAVENALLTRTIGRARAVSDTSPAGDSRQVAPQPPPSEPPDEHDRVRVLRWEFSRGRADRLTCELTLADDDSCYELRTLSDTTSSKRSIERFADATTAFQQQSALEGRLVEDGWSLEAYESLVIERPRPLPIAL